MPNPKRWGDERWRWLAFIVAAALFCTVITTTLIGAYVEHPNAPWGYIIRTAGVWAADTLTIGSIAWAIFVEGGLFMFVGRSDRKRIAEIEREREEERKQREEERKQAERRLATAIAEARAEGRDEERRRQARMRRRRES